MYHQESHAHKEVTVQLIDVSEAMHLFDLGDILNPIFQKGFADFWGVVLPFRFLILQREGVRARWTGRCMARAQCGW
jgi:hypothetical protein